MKLISKLILIYVSIVSFFILSVCTSADVSTRTAPVPRGIMAFGLGKNFLNTKSFDLPYISGMTAYFRWDDIEREEGKYDFSQVDTLVALAKSKGKVVNIGFWPGARSPEWLYKKGAKSFSWNVDLMEDQAKLRGSSISETSPLPWDPVFIESWKRFISKVAEKYKDEPSVGYINLSGPTIRAMPTAILIKSDADWERFVKSGYTYDKLLNAWIDIIEHYHKVLPNKRLVLVVAPNRPGRGARDISRARDIVNYIMQKKYTNISFMCVTLNDTWFLTARGFNDIRNLLKTAKANGFTFGYQMAQSAYRNSKWVRKPPIVENLRDSLSVGIADGASWIEVWHDDIIDPRGGHRAQGIPNSRYVDDLKWAYGQLVKK